MDESSTSQESANYVGVISGAYLIGLLESFANTRIVDPKKLPFSISSLEPTGWYPYHYLTDTLRLTEQILPDSSSILFWAGVRFMELWYRHGPGREMLSSGMEWVFANEHGEGYRSVAQGGTPNEIGWTKNLVTHPEEGYALVENVMPLRAEYLRGIYYGGFLLFDDMVYFDTEIYSESNDPELPHPRTVIKLLFRPKNKDISCQLLSNPIAIKNSVSMSPAENEEALWRIKHLQTLHNYREKYSRDLIGLLGKSLDELRHAKEHLQIINQDLLTESNKLREASAKVEAAHEQIMKLAVEQSKTEERDNLLREMHDGFGSQLTSARLLAESGRITVSELPQILQECMADLYLMADTLSNPNNTLLDSLADLKFRTVQRTSHLPIHLHWRIDVDDVPQVSQRIILQILRILQEALNNALKHAKARNILVDAIYNPAEETLTLTVSDDGVGFAENAILGRGLSNMKQRARLIGGSLNIEHASVGTVVRLSLPISATPST